MNVAVIPARGGSKRIPGKNIKLFLGKPIIAYSIEATLKAGIFDKVIVSTDSEEIASVAREYGAETPFIRPAVLADDFSGTTEVIAHAIKWFQENGDQISLVCCVYATSPFLGSETIIKGMKILDETNKKYSLTVTHFPSSIHRALKIDNNQLDMFWPENFNIRSQDLDEAYYDAGQMYCGRPKAFIDDLPLFANYSAPIILPNYLVQDIDTLDDWRTAELMYKAILLKRDKD
jgi:pseudaminic acid cytidylyltransferase